MGKKNGEKALEPGEEGGNFITREELDQFSIDIQKKFDGFAQGQVELHRQQSMAASDFQKGFDPLATMIANMNSAVGAPRADPESSTHQSSVHGQGEQLFLTFDGTCTFDFIKKAEKYFKLCHTPEEEKIQVVRLYFTGKADFWLEKTELDREKISWAEFCKRLMNRFASTYDVVKAFHALKQSGSVDEYIDLFEETVGLVRRKYPDIPESYYIKSFVCGLQDYEQPQIQKPVSLSDAFSIARSLEASNLFKEGGNSNWRQRNNYQRPTPVSKETTPKPAAYVPVTIPKHNMETVPTKSDKCFRCGEKWAVPGHSFRNCTMNKQVSAMLTKEEEATESDKCFRCGEKWAVPGHRFHCKMNKQVRAMLTKEEEDQEYLDALNTIDEKEDQEEQEESNVLNRTLQHISSFRSEQASHEEPSAPIIQLRRRGAGLISVSLLVLLAAILWAFATGTGYAIKFCKGLWSSSST
ncbi:hypothetical protein QYE76_029405 [Lolium multiflorum]|uniref:Retrotransposon gag domain-containing protein n=1 Tax=Lolium multiflorum TaxID=4521 RepID=A0AAD8VFH0_LOLMU|nr:hypothetical protein QYE76_029405 [Lolium multiflorum]